MKDEKLRLLCDINNMCYGSSSALLSILDYLNAETTVLSCDITRDILISDQLVDKIICVDIKNPHAVKSSVNLEDYNALLVISNQSNLDFYLDSGITIFFVDILFWYNTPKNHRIWNEAESCFVENFPGVCDKINVNSSHMKKPTLVGPLIKERKYEISIKKNMITSDFSGILVNIGGSTSRWVKPGFNSNYMGIVLNLINRIKAKIDNMEIIIAAGRDSVALTKGMIIPDGIRSLTLPHNEYLRLLSKCSLFITSPGLNAVFEGMEYQKPMLFLPPQNASQVLQLEKYEMSEIVPPGINLPNLITDFEIPEGPLDEYELTINVLNALRTMETNEEILEKAARHLLLQLEWIGMNEYWIKREKFLNKLWPTGGKKVAEVINNWWRNKNE